MIDILLDQQKIIIDELRKHEIFERDFFADIKFENSITGLVGHRGVGKTTFMVQKVSQNPKNLLYVSADNIYFYKNSLIELVDYIYKNTEIKMIFIDEVHKYPNWEQELKNISDIYKSIKIVFSGSSVIDIVRSKFDLSRRVSLFSFVGLSFREYLEYAEGYKHKSYKLAQLLDNHEEIARSIKIDKILMHFKRYLRVGYYPFSKAFNTDSLIFQAIENSVEKTIFEDITSIKNINTSSVKSIEKVYKYIVSSSAGELSVRGLSSDLGKDFDSVSEYIHLLDDAGLISSIFPKSSGRSFVRNPIKVLPSNTNMIYASYLSKIQDQTIGKVREAFFVSQLQNSQNDVFYIKNGDFSVDKFNFEIGGASKGSGQMKNIDNGYVVRDEIVTGSNNFMPLYLFGFLY